MIDDAFVRSGRVLAVGLTHGLLGRAEAIAWADTWAARLDPVPEGLWAVSMPGRDNLQDLLDAVIALVGAPGVDELDIVAALIGRSTMPPVAAGSLIGMLATEYDAVIDRARWTAAKRVEHWAHEAADGIAPFGAEALAELHELVRVFGAAWADEVAALTSAR